MAQCLVWGRPNAPIGDERTQKGPATLAFAHPACFSMDLCARCLCGTANAPICWHGMSCTLCRDLGVPGRLHEHCDGADRGVAARWKWAWWHACMVASKESVWGVERCEPAHACMVASKESVWGVE
eukprot:353214-Chlamydomonas_euryale.AAC.8